METAISQSNRSWKVLIFFSILFLLFFQLIADFIESIYTFGLLGTNIPPEIVSILFFFSPLLLFFRRKPVPFKVGLFLTGLVGLLRAFEVVAAPAPKMLAGGLGVGLLLVSFPILLINVRIKQHFRTTEMGAGLLVSLALSILLRTLGAGSDISLLVPAVSWLLTAGLLLIIALLWRTAAPAEAPSNLRHSGFGAIAGLSIGFLSALFLLYFAFTSPTVLSRWTDVDFRLILLVIALSLSAYVYWQAAQKDKPLTKIVLLAWNILFVLSGTATIMVNQVTFPKDSSAFPLFQPDLNLLQQIPLFFTLILSPVVLADFTALSSELFERQPTMRQLAGGFTIAALIFLLLVLAQVFTTVYDYIPIIGPWFRDRFWLVFLIAGLFLLLPLLLVRRDNLPTDLLSRGIVIPLVVSALVLAVLVAVLREPQPQIPAEQTNLRVVTYNLQQGYDAAGQRAYQQQLAEIQSLHPDVVGLQETDVARFSGGNADLVRFIAEGLDMHVYYGPKTVTGTFGIALLSRYPLEDPQTFFMYSVGEQTAAIRAGITVNGKPLTILVTHLGNGGPILQQQQVLQELNGQKNIIAMGDFNFRPDTEQYALTAQQLDNAWVLSGSPLTEGIDPTRLIDHVFVSPGTIVRSAAYLNSPVSDHPGLVVDIAP